MTSPSQPKRKFADIEGTLGFASINLGYACSSRLRLLYLQFESVIYLPVDDQSVVKEVLDTLIIKY